MGLLTVVEPKRALSCDTPACMARFEPASRISHCIHAFLRAEAAEAGWSVRPTRGPGSRKGPDLCPSCAANAEVAAVRGAVA